MQHNFKETITNLARLSHAEYEFKRLPLANELKIRVAALDEMVKKSRQQLQETSSSGSIIFPAIDPWNQIVDGSTLLSSLALTIKNHVILGEHDANAIALWIVFTHCIDSTNVAPILNICSPEKRCGKSTLLSLLENLVHRPLLASNISPAAIFRTIEEHKPTLLLDEVDTFINNEKSELRGIINSGHSRSSAFVIRTVGDNHTPQKFSTWGAKCLAGIGNIPDTIKDRSISINLRRKLQGEEITKLRRTSKAHLAELQMQCQRFAADNGFRISSSQPETPFDLNDRAADSWESLFVISDIAGGKWPSYAREASLHLSSDDESITGSVELLQNIRNIFEEKMISKISTAELLTALCLDTESPWATYNRGQPMSPRQLAKKLKEFKIQSGTIRLPNGTTPKGYYRENFDDIFKRYIPSNDATTPQINALGWDEYLKHA